MVLNQLSMRSLSSVINPYEWTPYGYSAPILLDGETRTVETTTSTPVDKSKFLLK
jgi:hypothetical protein